MRENLSRSRALSLNLPSNIQAPESRLSSPPLRLHSLLLRRHHQTERETRETSSWPLSPLSAAKSNKAPPGQALFDQHPSIHAPKHPSTQAQTDRQRTHRRLLTSATAPARAGTAEAPELETPSTPRPEVSWWMLRATFFHVLLEQVYYPTTESIPCTAIYATHF